MTLDKMDQAAALLDQLQELDRQLSRNKVISASDLLPVDVFKLLEAEALKALTEKRAAIQLQFDNL